MPLEQPEKIQHYFEIDADAAVEELHNAGEEEPQAQSVILADIARISGWDNLPDVVIVTPKSIKWDWQDGGMMLGKPDGTGAINLEPGVYRFSQIPITSLVFRGTSETETQAHERNSQFRMALARIHRRDGVLALGRGMTGK